MAEPGGGQGGWTGPLNNTGAKKEQGDRLQQVQQRERLRVVAWPVNGWESVVAQLQI